MTLKSPKTLKSDAPPQSLGEHIRRRRQQLGLTQQEVGIQLNVSEFTVLNWENAKTDPPVKSMPAILQFLGYDPFPEPKTVPEKLRAYRCRYGLSIAEAAKRIGVDEGTWGGWEAGKLPTAQRLRILLADFAFNT